MCSVTKQIRLAVAVLGLMTWAAGRAEAGQIVSYDFSGHARDDTSVTFVGHLSYDTDTPGFYNHGTDTSFFYPDSSHPMTLAITIRSSSGETTYGGITQGGVGLNFAEVRSTSFNMRYDLANDGATGSVYLDLYGSRPRSGPHSLPTSLTLSDFQFPYISVLKDGEAVLFPGVLDTLTPAVSAVPEPSTLLSAGIAGLIGLGYAWRRRSVKSAV